MNSGTRSRFLIVCCCLFFGCSPSSTPSLNTTTVPDFADWQPFRSDEGRFSIMLPGKAVDITVEPSVKTFGVLLDGEMEYFVAWSDHTDAIASAGSEGVFSRATDSHTQGNQILKNESITVLDKPAKEVVYVDAENDVFHLQLVLADNRLYQVGFLTPKSKYSPTGNNLDKFFKSFQILR